MVYFDLLEIYYVEMPKFTPAAPSVPQDVNFFSFIISCLLTTSLGQMIEFQNLG